MSKHPPTVDGQLRRRTPVVLPAVWLHHCAAMKPLSIENSRTRPPTLTVTRERLPSNSFIWHPPSRDAIDRRVLKFALPIRGHQATAPRLAMDLWSSGGELAATSLGEAALGPRRRVTSLRTSRALVALRLRGRHGIIKLTMPRAYMASVRQMFPSHRPSTGH